MGEQRRGMEGGAGTKGRGRSDVGGAEQAHHNGQQHTRRAAVRRSARRRPPAQWRRAGGCRTPMAAAARRRMAADCVNGGGEQTRRCPRPESGRGPNQGTTRTSPWPQSIGGGGWVRKTQLLKRTTGTCVSQRARCAGLSTRAAFHLESPMKSRKEGCPFEDIGERTQTAVRSKGWRRRCPPHTSGAPICRGGSGSNSCCSTDSEPDRELSDGSSGSGAVRVWLARRLRPPASGGRLHLAAQKRRRRVQALVSGDVIV